MKTKEAIDFLLRKRSGLPIDLETKWDEVIELLQRGEKYEQMYKESYNMINGDTVIPENIRQYPTIDIIKRLLEDIKQKYFPEPIKKTITIDKDLLFDIAKNIDKSFREYVKQHTVRALPISSDDLAIFSDSIMEGIKDIVNELKEGD